jgi:Zn-dependent M28 family amino/carboxypeptidase
VGRGYFWLERIRWTDEQIRSRLGDPAVSFHVLTVAHAPAGFFELEKHRDGSVEITYFGLLPEFLVLKYNVPFYFGGTSLLIIVVVTMDFWAQVQSYVMSQQYESLLKKANFKTS